jgi:hypothetical protein
MASHAFEVVYIGVARVRDGCILASITNRVDKHHDYMKNIKALIATPDNPQTVNEGPLSHHLLREPVSSNTFLRCRRFITVRTCIIRSHYESSGIRTRVLCDNKRRLSVDCCLWI